MQFGKTDTPEEIDFTLPKDHPDNQSVLAKKKVKRFMYM